MQRCAGFILGLCLVLAGPARAQDWKPDHPIHILVGFSPGSTLDLMARALAPPISAQLGVGVIVDNRSGGSGRLALELNAAATPDGTSIELTGTGPLSINPALQQFTLPKMQPITQIATGPMAIVVNSDNPAKTLAELVTAAKAKPGSVSFGSAGIGSTPHLAGELFAAKAAIELTHVPYRGNMDALNDVLAGRVDILMTGLPPAMPMVQAGKLRALAVAADTRSPMLPDVPTVAEAGVPGAEAASNYGMIGPPGLPPPVLKRLQAEIAKAVSLPNVEHSFVLLGATTVTSEPDGYARTIAADTEKWSVVIKNANITVQ